MLSQGVLAGGTVRIPLTWRTFGDYDPDPCSTFALEDRWRARLLAIQLS